MKLVVASRPPGPASRTSKSPSWSAPGKSLRAYRWGLGAASALCALTGVAWILLPIYGVPLP